MPTVLDALKELADEEHPTTIDGDYTYVKCINRSSFPVKMEYNRRKFHLAPGEDKLVPYFCMVLYCGDPRAFDVPNDERRKFRTNEWKRLRVLYGVYDYTSDPSYLAKLPDIEVYTPSGLRITTVLDDPTGESMDVQAQQLTETEKAKQESKLLRAELDKVLARLDQLEKPVVAPDPLVIPELDESRRTDTPIASPVESQPATADLVMSTDDLVAPSTSIPTKKPGSRA